MEGEGSPGCVNCALLVAEVEEDEEVEHLAIFLIPGLFFLAIGLRCGLVGGVRLVPLVVGFCLE